MVFLCDFFAMAIGFLLGFYGVSMVLWYFDGIAMASLWDFHDVSSDISLGLFWDFHGFSQGFL